MNLYSTNCKVTKTGSPQLGRDMRRCNARPREEWLFRADALVFEPPWGVCSQNTESEQASLRQRSGTG